MNRHHGDAGADGIAVLMTMYAGGDADELRAALRSVYAQTVPPAQVVVVEDGPLLADQSAVLDGFVDAAPPLTRVRLPENRGSGPAAAAGLDVVDQPWVARLDADDIAVPTRLEQQLAAVAAAAAAGSPVDVIGGAMAEFDAARAARGVPPADCVTGIRRLPADHAAIARYARINNPVNHPTLLARTDLLRAAGGYRPVPRMEDYDLMARLLAAGARFANLDEPLVYFRTSDAVFDRRTETGMFAAERQMQRNLRAYGLISAPRAWFNLAARTAFRLLPRRALRGAYRRLFHR